jgi:hypothetical protein
VLSTELIGFLTKPGEASVEKGIEHRETEVCRVK